MQFQSQRPFRYIINSLTALIMLYSTHTLAESVNQQHTQVPGYYRMQLGEYEVTALYDGYVSIEQKLLQGISEKDVQQLLEQMFVTDNNGVQTSVNAYLINTGNNMILIDTGTANCFGPTLGFITQNLQAAGYQPAQIDTVLLTHLHGDHACGLTKDGEAQFPNATVYVSKPEADFWLDNQIMANSPDELKPFIKMTQDAVAPYLKADKLKQYNAGEQLFDAIKIVSTPGHTPGHTSYLLESQGKQMLIWGDIVHSHAVQFTYPEVAIDFDTDPKQAIETRKMIFQQAANDKLWIGGAHMPFPGIGHVKAGSEGYRWVPIEYSPIQ